MLNSKFQIRISKPIPNSKQKFKVLVLALGIYLGFSIANLGFVSDCYAIDLSNAKTYFLKGSYQECINECENILASAGYSKDLDELYYILALSYMKQDNLLRASDIFEIIINEFHNGKFKEDALFGLGDIYFLKADFENAENKYKFILQSNPDTKLKALVLFRLAQNSLKMGKWQEAQGYLDSLNTDFPLSLENRLAKNLSPQEFFFTVQVGAFSDISNARNLCKELNDKGYSAYIQESGTNKTKLYHVRVGRLNSRLETEELGKKLMAEGYPTKIYP